MKNLLVPLFFLLTLVTSHAETDELTATLHTLKKELQAEIEVVKSQDPKNRDSEYLRELTYILSKLDSSEISWDDPQPEWQEQIEQAGRSSRSPKVIEASRAITSGLAVYKKEQLAKLKEELYASLRTTLQTGLAATKASDLDAPILEVTKWQQQLSAQKYQTYGESFKLDDRELRSVSQILVSIQDTFLAASSKNARREEAILLRRFRSNGEFYHGLDNIIPRSELLSKLDAVSERIFPGQKILTKNEFETEVQKMLAEVKKLEDLNTLFQRINDLSAQQKDLGGYDGDSDLTYKLITYRGIYDNLQGGSSTNIAMLDVESEVVPSLQLIRNQLIRFALPRLLGEPAGLTLAEGESAQSFLKRAMAQALDNSDWPLLSRVVSVAANLRVTQIATLNDENTMEDFLGAVNLHRAKQYAPAVTAYLQVLRSGWQIIPAERIGEMLAVIEKEDPAAYKEGLNPAPRPAASSGRVIYQPPPMPTGPDIVLDGIDPSARTSRPPAKPALSIPPKSKPKPQPPTTPANN